MENYTSAKDTNTVLHYSEAPETVCLNATTGEPIWNVLLTAIESAMPIADGILTTINGYDNQIYAIRHGTKQNHS